MKGGVEATADVARVAAQLRLAMMRMVRRIKRETGGAEPAWVISALAAIHRAGAPTLGELAEAEGISRPTVTAQSGALEARGLVEREASPGDRRVVRLRITTRGQRLLDRSRAERTAWFARRLRDLPPEDVAALASAAAVLERRLAEEGR